MKLPEPKYTVTDANHKYTITLPTGETVGPLKSVTGILQVLDKPALVGWSARESANYFKAELLRLGKSALNPAMLDQIAKDAAGAHRRKAKDAADLGTKCHDIFEAIIKGKEPGDIPTELAEPARDFKRWRLSTDIEYICTCLDKFQSVRNCQIDIEKSPPIIKRVGCYIQYAHNGGPASFAIRM